ncbi:unnamed protein product [Closterium sp. NIES-54]
MGDRASQTCGKFHTEHHWFSRLNDAWRAEFGDEAERSRWLELLRSGVDIFALDYDAILAAMYALSVSAEGECYLYVPPNLGIEAAALGARESALPGTVPAEALHTFTLDSGASHCFFRDNTTLTPLPAPVPGRLADPSGGLLSWGGHPPVCIAHQLNLWPRVSFLPLPHCPSPPPPPPLFLALGPPPVDPLPPQGPAPSGVSHVDPLRPAELVEVIVDSGASRVAASWGAESASAEPGGAEPVSAEPGGAEP